MVCALRRGFIAGGTDGLHAVLLLQWLSLGVELRGARYARLCHVEVRRFTTSGGRAGRFLDRRSGAYPRGRRAYGTHLLQRSVPLPCAPHHGWLGGRPRSRVLVSFGRLWSRPCYGLSLARARADARDLSRGMDERLYALERLRISNNHGFRLRLSMVHVSMAGPACRVARGSVRHGLCVATRRQPRCVRQGATAPVGHLVGFHLSGE